MNTLRRKDIKGDSIKSLPSVYRGVTFRSRLEARWAAYFDLLQIEWIYEPEGFELPSGNYCPDFQIKTLGYAEVKPNKESADYISEKLQELAMQTCENVFCFIGNPQERMAHFVFCHEYNWVAGNFTRTGEISSGSGSFTYRSVKKWNDLDYCGIYDDDDPWLGVINRMRFENGVCYDDYRTLAPLIKP